MTLGDNTNPEMQPIEKPYHGGIEVYDPEGSKNNYIFYAGEANQRHKVVPVPNEDSSTVDYMMKSVPVAAYRSQG